MIYDRDKAAKMLRIALEITAGAIDVATRPGGEPSLRAPALQAEKTLRTLAVKGDVDAMYQEYLRILREAPELGRTLDRLHHRSLESELYRFVKVYWEREP